MNKFVRLFSVTLVLIFTSCSTCSSSIAYTEGTQYLEKKDYSNAINCLEKAVALDPTVSRNHTNLCAAYMGVKNIQKAWEHARAATLCAYKDDSADINFRNFYNALIRNKYDQPGKSFEDITTQLGSPDILKDGLTEGDKIVIYGNCEMNFVSNKLTTCVLTH